MPHDVFISYAQADAEVARTICDTLERAGIPCWIAPRDIPPAAQYPGAITAGIAAAKVVVLVFSNHANQSPDVNREIGIAFQRKKTVVPFRLEAVPLGEQLEYFLGRTQWIEGFPSPLQRHLPTLAQAVGDVLQRPVQHVPLPQPTPWWPRAAAAAALVTVLSLGLWVGPKAGWWGGSDDGITPLPGDSGGGEGQLAANPPHRQPAGGVPKVGSPDPAEPPLRPLLDGVLVRVVHTDVAEPTAREIRQRLQDRGARVELRRERDVPPDRLNSIVYLAAHQEAAAGIRELLRDLVLLELQLPSRTKQDSSIVVWLAGR